MNSPGDHKPGGGTRPWSRELGPFLTLGLQLAFAVVGFFFLGRWADHEFGTNPWLTLLGLGLGMAGGFVKFFRTARQLGEQSDRAAEKEERDG